jgi:ABC-type polysaccharide/polyol phosphate transport system ATPase subunit
MSNAIVLGGVAKYYKLYATPRDRFKEALNPYGKTYHRKYYALKDISLEIKKGEVLGVMGKNGCGKSTLLKLISRVLKPSKGTIDVIGSVSALLELGSGFNPEFTGVQNIFFYGTILGFSRREMEDKLDSILAFAGIGDFVYQPLKTYSSGMKARLGFAVAVSVDPDILIVDEVLAVGDALFQKKCYNKINQLFNDGKTVIFVSHNTQSVIQFCHRAILLNNGEIEADGEPKKIVSSYEKLLFSNELSHESVKNKKPISEDLGYIEQENHKCEDFDDNLYTEPYQTNKQLASIFDYSILDKNGKSVNVLDRSEIYTISFKVKYLTGLDKVAPGVQIKNLEGYLISGVNLSDYQNQIIEHVTKGQVIHVRCEFKCNLSYGNYTVDLSSMALETEIDIKMHDSILFKVRPDVMVNGGVVGLEQVLTVEDDGKKEYLKLASYK